MSDRLEMQPPNDKNAEKALLGGIMLLPEIIDDVQPILHPNDFYDPDAERLYALIVELWNQKRAVDVQILASALEGKEWFTQAGGVAWLAELWQMVPTAANSVHYANAVAEKSSRRGLIRAGTEVVKLGYASDEQDPIGTAEAVMFRALERRDQKQLESLRDVLTNTLLQLDQSGQTAKRGTSSGYTDLDNVLGGLRESELVILAARPSMGKTALATCIAMYVAKRGEHVLFSSLEMSSIDLGDRMLSVKSGVSLLRMRNGTLSGDDRRKLIEAAADMGDWPLFVNDKSTQSVADIASAARRMARGDGLDLIVVDYLQLIKPADRRAPREQQISDISRTLKHLAKDLSVPVLCLSQLNRQSETAKENRPQLSHLRESGAIEQDADVVMFVHRPEYYATNADDRQKLAGQACAIVAKNRNGPTGDVPLVWMKDCTRFVSQAAKHKENYNPSFAAYNEADDDEGETF